MTQSLDPENGYLLTRIVYLPKIAPLPGSIELVDWSNRNGLKQCQQQINSSENRGHGKSRKVTCQHWLHARRKGGSVPVFTRLRRRNQIRHCAKLHAFD